MGIARSTFYDRPDAGADDAAVVAQMKAICDEFETYGYRRVDAELRHRGIVVNAKKVRRLMREHALNPKRHRRFIATTDSNHNYPICPNLATNMTLNGPNQLWVADITYVAITTNIAYLAVILDAWSPRVVGYAIQRDRTTILQRRQSLPRAGCIAKPLRRAPSRKGKDRSLLRSFRTAAISCEIQMSDAPP